MTRHKTIKPFIFANFVSYENIEEAKQDLTRASKTQAAANADGSDSDDEECVPESYIEVEYDLSVGYCKSKKFSDIPKKTTSAKSERAALRQLCKEES